MTLPRALAIRVPAVHSVALRTANPVQLGAWVPRGALEGRSLCEEIVPEYLKQPLVLVELRSLGIPARPLATDLHLSCSQ